MANLPAGANTFQLTGKPPGTYTYRVAALFNNPISGEPIVTGPYSNPRCVTVLQGPEPVGVASRKTHNVSGTYDVPLALTGPVTTEPRESTVAGEHTVVFTFPTAVTTQGAAVSSGQGSVTGVSQNGNENAVNLSGVPDVQTITVTLVQASDGSTTGNVSARMGVLLGDTNGDRFVNAGDAVQTRNRSGQQADIQNFRSDVNTDGVVNAGDSIIVRSRSGNTLPAQ